MLIDAPATLRSPAYAIDCGLIEDWSRRGLGAPADAFPEPGVRLNYCRDEEVFGEGEPAEFVYRVISGAVRTYRILSDGRRQICEFYLPGDVLGLEAGAEHRLGAEAISSTVLMVLRRRSLADRAAADRALARHIWEMTLNSLQRTQDHMLLLGRQSACERVCAFLLDLADRLPDAREMELPMSRQDIADYLGLTIETISRTFTQLQSAGWIRLTGTRRVIFTNPGAIARVCG